MNYRSESKEYEKFLNFDNLDLLCHVESIRNLVAKLISISLATKVSTTQEKYKKMAIELSKKIDFIQNELSVDEYVHSDSIILSSPNYFHIENKNNPEIYSTLNTAVISGGINNGNLSLRFKDSENYMNLNADYSKEVFEVLECISIGKLFKAYISNGWVDQEINTNVPKSIEREISTLNKIYVNSLISMEDLGEYIIRKYIRNESERITAISNSDRESAEALLKILELKLGIDQKVDLIEKITDFLATKEVAHGAIPTKALIFHFSQGYILGLTNNESAGNEIENDKQIINKKLHDIGLLILQHSTKGLELAEVEKITGRKLKRLNEQYN